MIYTEGREQFEEMLARHESKLRGATIEYIGGLNDADRTDILKIALDAAWEHRGEFKVREGYGLPQYWRRCLRFAATSRERWLVSYATLPGVFERRWVLGVHLGGR